MFSLANEGKSSVEDACAPPAPAASPAPRTIAANPPAASPERHAPSRYGADGRSRLPVLVGVLALHISVGAVLLQQGYVAVSHPADRLEMVELSMSPPPPPPSEAIEPPPPAAPDIVAPPPIVRTPVAQAVPVAVTPVALPVSGPVPAVTITDTISRPAPAPASPARAETIEGGDLGTQMISAKPPKYPIECRRKREQGTVILSLTLGLDGAVRSIAIAQSSGFARLDDAARDAVRRWRWAPTIRGGQPVMVRGLVEIPFILSN